MIRIKALSEPPAPDDGRRLLITRYRPRFVKRGQETWDEWETRLAPSISLLDLAFGKRREGSRVVARGLEPIAWEDFARRYRAELDGPEGQAALAALRERSGRGETVTLLCYCRDAQRCHRSLARALVQETDPPAGGA